MTYDLGRKDMVSRMRKGHRLRQELGMGIFTPETAVDHHSTPPS